MQRTEDHLKLIDQMRGIAILAVFAFHCLHPSFGHDQLTWGRWFPDFFTAKKSFLAVLPLTFGWAGVAIFFVVSGFCIHLSYLRHTAEDWRGFYIRRFFRIYPPYFVALIVFALLFPLSRLSFDTSFDWIQLASHLLLVHNLDERTFLGINGAFWTIAIEAQLYLLYPVLLGLVNRLGWKRALIALGVVELLMRGIKGIFIISLRGDAPQWFAGAPLFYWYSWAIGAAIADAYVRQRDLPFRTWPAGILLSSAIATSYILPLFHFSFLLFAVLTATLLARRLTTVTPLPLPRPLVGYLRLVGRLSYSLYLLQQPLLIAVCIWIPLHFATPVHPLVMLALCIAAYPFILAVSWLSYRFCERPSIALGKIFLRKLRALPENAVPPRLIPAITRADRGGD
jgi:peptidoglycan/LPS O-acetylase OafA/YrhL